MTNTKIHHLNWIETNLIPNLVKNQKLIELKSSCENVKLKSFEIKEMSHTVAFSLTCCYFVNIVCELEDNNNNRASIKDEQIFHLFVKITPPIDETLYDLFNFSSLFTNEIVAYEFILPNLQWLLNTPKYYYSHNRPSEAAIVLSNFAIDGWRMSSNRFNLSIDHIMISVKRLGEFHGNMYALKHTDAQKFVTIKNKLVEPRYNHNGSNDEWMLRLKHGIKRATKSVRDSNEFCHLIPEEFLQQIETVTTNVYMYQKKCIQPIEPIAIICHGDYLRNNIAYRYNDNGKAMDAMMFDFQTLRYASPMVDVNTFMALSTGRNERDQHFWDIFQTYYDTLIQSYLTSTNLKVFDIPEYLKYDNMLREYVRYLPFGLTIAGSFLYSIHEPIDFYNGDFKMSLDDTLKDAYSRGGNAIDFELCALVVDIFQLHQKLNMTLTEMLN